MADQTKMTILSKPKGNTVSMSETVQLVNAFDVI